jgi:hypothetical protein
MNESFLDSQIQILERSQASWNANAMPALPDDLSPYGIPGMTKIAISNAFPMIISRLKNIKKIPLEQSNPFLIQTITQNFPSWTSPLEAWIVAAPSGPSVIPNIVSHLNAMWSQLNTYIGEPSVEELKKLTSEIKHLQSEASALLKLNTNLNKRKDELSEAFTYAKKLSKESKSLLDETVKSKATIEADAAVAGSHRATIETDQAAATELLGILKATTESIPEFEKNRDEITRKCDEILAEAKIRLDASSKVGMAVSFSDQAKAYIWPRRLWLASFVLSLIGIVVIAKCYILQEILKLEGVDRLSHFLTDLPLTLPFIWLAWFSALRFSQLGRLREDYAFKVATALALDGYRKQAEDLSPALQEKLLDLAVTNFGENPLRLMTKDSAKDAHPLAGIIDENSWSEILKEGIKSITDKVRK